MATTGDVREINLSKMREYAHSRGGIRIAEAARDTGLSIPTAASLINELIGAGEILEAGVCASTGGRKAVSYRLNPSFLTYLLIRVEAEHLSWQLRDYTGGTVESGAADIPCGMLAELDRLISDTQDRYPTLRATYIGVAGMVSNGKIERIKRKRELQGLDVPTHFEQFIKTPVYIGNDTNIVASGCWARLRLEKGALVCLYENELGAGAGLMINGKLWQGRNGLPGELGYIQSVRQARAKTRDRQSGLEYYSSIICMYAAMLDPDRIIMYSNRVCEVPPIEDIRAYCAKHLSAEYVPALEVSDRWDDDYLLGMDNETRMHLGIR